MASHRLFLFVVVVGVGMVWMFRKAGYSLFVTSFTTAVAFLGNCFSRIKQTRDFGLFLGVLVCVNYCLVMTMYASTLVLFDTPRKFVVVVFFLSHI